MTIGALLRQIEESRDADDTWCDLEKAETLAALVLATRPKLICELGVWRGASLLPQLLALKFLGSGHALAIDSWSVEASVSGQVGDHAKWWSETGEEGHENAFLTFMNRLEIHGITAAYCTVHRQRCDAVDVPSSIDILHHDANHGPQSVLDIERWAPNVRQGGFLIIDDTHWAGGHVLRARDCALKMGFIELYSLGTGSVLQRVSHA